MNLMYLQYFAQTLDCAAEKGKTFFGLPKWYRYLPYNFQPLTNRCEIQVGDIRQYWLIGLGLFDILLRLAGIIAIGFVIYGGIRYILSQGEPDNTRVALSTIINAMIGLLIAVMASAIVGFVGARLGGP
jgi:hypothetical protein